MRNHVSTLQPLADKAAIGLSLLCVIHCLALPLVVVLLPALVSLGFEDEKFHTWMVFIVLPLSVFALTMGCRKHRSALVLATGSLGLVLLCLTAFLGHELLGESGEKLLTLTGASLIAVSHVRNYLLCREGSDCECPDQSA